MERFNNRFANILLSNNERTDDESDLESLSDSIESLSDSIESLSDSGESLSDSVESLADSFINETNTISNQIQNYINQLMETRYNNEFVESLNTEFLNSYPGDMQNLMNHSFDTDTVQDVTPTATEVFAKYDSLNTIKNDKEETCSICLDEIKINKKIYNISCNHKFHKKCLKNWLKEKFSCPTCRINI